MKEKSKEYQEGTLKEIKLPIGEVLQLEDGMVVYVIPVDQLKEMGEKDLTNLKREIEARELVKEAEERAKKHIAEGWTEEDFKKQFLAARRKISQFLSKKEHESRKGK